MPGFKTTLMQPSCLSRNVLYIWGPLSSGSVWVMTKDECMSGRYPLDPGSLWRIRTSGILGVHRVSGIRNGEYVSSLRSSCSARCQNSSWRPSGLPLRSQISYARLLISFSVGSAMGCAPFDEHGPASGLGVSCRTVHGPGRCG
jgi:hypothetical protein